MVNRMTSLMHTQRELVPRLAKAVGYLLAELHRILMDGVAELSGVALDAGDRSGVAGIDGVGRKDRRRDGQYGRGGG
jgi:hypothetical protein